MQILRNFGICGAVTKQIYEKEMDGVREFKPTLSILLAGTNDTCNQDTLQDLDVYRAYYRKILSELNALGSRVIVMTPPPIIEDTFYRNFTKEAFHGVSPVVRMKQSIRIIREEALNFGAALADVHEAFMQTELETQNSYVRNRFNYGGVDDGCHPTDAGYSKIAEMLYQKIQEIHADTSRIACIGDSITYGAYEKGAGTVVGNNYPGRLNVLLNPVKEKVKPHSDFVKKSVVYQMFLRAFTKEGTLAAAEKELKNVAKTGADVIYLCPVVKSDADDNRDCWSDRQKASKCENPRSPYRIADYYEIDPEYGTDNDLKSFIAKSHSLGMKVILDLVYYHAGPSFAKAHPDFVKHDENGKPLMGRWHFPELDFENPDLREYLWENMEYFIRDFDADGYRCDVGDAVPLDFWAEGRRRMEKIKKEIYFISESEIAARNTDQIETFDGNYGFSWGYQAYTFTGSMPAQYLRQIWRERKSESPQGALFFYALENHDIANDSYERRFEKEWGGNAVEAALFMNFMMDGIPFLYNGEEYGDSARHSIFSLPGQMYIDRTHAGSERLAFIRALSDFHHTEKALYDGILNWLDEELPVNNSIMAWERVKDDERIIICVNTCGKMQNAVLHTLYNREQSRILMNHRAEFRMENECLHVQLMPYGFFAVKEKIN